MLNIIKIEWLKVKYYRTFWIFLGLAVLIIPAVNAIVQDVNSRIPKQIQQALGRSIYDFPIVWQTVAYVSSFTTVIFGFLLLTLVTNEFSFKTHRQHVIDGWERRELVLSKLFWVVAFSVIALLVSALTAAYFGAVYGKESFSLEGFRFLFYYFLQVMLSLCLALLLGVLVKRTGLAIVLYLAYVMVLEQLVVMTLKRFVGDIGGLMPLQTADELLPLPVVDKLVPLAGPLDTYVYLTALLAYIGLSLWWVFHKMLRTDL
ncbi:ABC transporter permease [Chitinophaga tropicalis]|uniref:ABC transporter permease subunit n=1 Tax=Chitinophaga tropicalis TaxID=2683588 RepID=A0A7K1UC82_9BACT|nr:ABC transporter permease [Chitinophaga tropicalis]MVT11916.1 ABC transporter permease subunit [Chitinophaga tropicalis]